MTKILLVMTGGTIGSSSKDGVINLDTQSRYQLLQLYNENPAADCDAELIPIAPLTMLSENAQPSHWTTLTNVIKEQLKTNEYQGVIVTHGTDTLAFGATALAFSLAGVSIPVVFVSSDKPLENPAGNGMDNFRGAVRFICKERHAGVFTVYRNPDGICKVHLGSRICSAVPFLHSHESENITHIAELQNGIFTYLNGTSWQAPHQTLDVELAPIFNESVLRLRPYPGLRYDFIDLSAKPKAIIHGLYHSSTACTQTTDPKFSLLHFAKRCEAHKIPLYLVPIPREGDIYDSCKELLDASVIPLHGLSQEAALVKTMLAYGNEDLLPDIPYFLNEVCLAGEFVE